MSAREVSLKSVQAAATRRDEPMARALIEIKLPSGATATYESVRPQTLDEILEGGAMKSIREMRKIVRHQRKGKA